MIKKNNKGYSLVEMIIVLAVMSILAAMSLVTISMIQNARAQAACTTFNNELTTIAKQTSVGSAQTAIRVFTDDDGYFCVEYGSNTETGFTADSSKEIYQISKRVEVYYGTSQLDDNGQIIQFSKADGSVLTGSGTYTFYKENANTNPYALVKLYQSTGKHEVK